MARKKQPNSTPAKQREFHSAPFTALKGVIASPCKPDAPEPAPPATPPPPKEADDSLQFLQAMGGVRRLGAPPATKSTGRSKKEAPTPPTPIQRNSIDPDEQEAFSQAIGQLKLDVTFADNFPEEDELKPLGTNRLRQLKKGVIRVDRQLDLHGLTRDEALESLPRFLHNARAHGENAVLVITGRGNNSLGEPVLQQAVSAWLRDAGKEFVLEFAPAPREMGGSGAFVLFLRT